MADLYTVHTVVESEPTSTRFEFEENARTFADALSHQGFKARVVDEFEPRDSDDKVVYEPEPDRYPNGLYLIADTPPTAHPVAVEDGTGDHGLLAEALANHPEAVDEARDHLPDVPDDQPGYVEVCDALFEALAALADLHERIAEAGDDGDRVVEDVWSAYDLDEANDVFDRTGHERADGESPDDTKRPKGH